jgi:hypothetical protein
LELKGSREKFITDFEKDAKSYPDSMVNGNEIKAK